MRVAIHYKDGSVAAYRFGRIEDGVHNVHPIFGHMAIDQFVDELIKSAHEEFDGDPNVDRVVLERMVVHPDNDDESVWIHYKEFDPEIYRPTSAGNMLAATVASDVRS